MRGRFVGVGAVVLVLVVGTAGGGAVEVGSIVIVTARKAFRG